MSEHPYKVFKVVPDVPSKVVTEGKDLEGALEKNLKLVSARNKPMIEWLKQFDELIAKLP